MRHGPCPPHRAGRIRNGGRYSYLSVTLRYAKADYPAFADFPSARWARIWIANPIGLVNKGVKRRSDVFGILMNTPRLHCCGPPLSIMTNGRTPNPHTGPRPQRNCCSQRPDPITGKQDEVEPAAHGHPSFAAD